MCNSATNPHPTRPTLTFVITAFLSGRAHLTAYRLARKLYAEQFHRVRDSVFITAGAFAALTAIRRVF
jgi:hypothetical protein